MRFGIWIVLIAIGVYGALQWFGWEDFSLSALNTIRPAAPLESAPPNGALAQKDSQSDSQEPEVSSLYFSREKGEKVAPPNMEDVSEAREHLRVLQERAFAVPRLDRNGRFVDKPLRLRWDEHCRNNGGVLPIDDLHQRGRDAGFAWLEDWPKNMDIMEIGRYGTWQGRYFQLIFSRIESEDFDASFRVHLTTFADPYYTDPQRVTPEWLTEDRVQLKDSQELYHKLIADLERKGAILGARRVIMKQGEQPQRVVVEVENGTITRWQAAKLHCSDQLDNLYCGCPDDNVFLP